MNLDSDPHLACAQWICDQSARGRAAVFCSLIRDGDIDFGQLFTMPMTATVNMRMEYQKDEFVGVYDQSAEVMDVLSDLAEYWFGIDPTPRAPEMDPILAEELCVAGSATALKFATVRMHVECARDHLANRFLDVKATASLLQQRFGVSQATAYRRVEQAQRVLAARRS